MRVKPPGDRDSRHGLATEIDAASPSVNAPGRRICGATQSASAEERQGLTGQEILA